MPASTYQQELDFAKAVALKAGDIMLQFFDGDQQKEIKDDGSPVTIADKRVNHLVIEEVGKAFPADGVIGEEESTATYGSGRRWICDPIDGTMAFTWGLPSAMFSLALLIDGQPVMGVAYNPFLKQIFWGIKGAGSFCDGKPLKVSDDDLKTGTVAIAPIMKDIVSNEPYFMKLLEAIENKQLAIFSGAVFRGCLISKGKLVGYPDTSLKPYDVAAVHVIVEEAGGKITDLTGQPLDYTKAFRGALISNGLVHDELLAIFND